MSERSVCNFPFAGWHPLQCEQVLVGDPKLPRMLMRSIILSAQKYPKLQSFLVQLLSQLVQKRSLFTTAAATQPRPHIH